MTSPFVQGLTQGVGFAVALLIAVAAHSLVSMAIVRSHEYHYEAPADPDPDPDPDDEQGEEVSLTKPIGFHSTTGDR